MDLHTTEIVGFGLQLNKTVCKTEFIVNLTRNDIQKRQKRPKRHILALCFPLGARVAWVAPVTDNKPCLAYHNVFIYKLLTNYFL